MFLSYSLKNIFRLVFTYLLRLYKLDLFGILFNSEFVNLETSNEKLVHFGFFEIIVWKGFSSLFLLIYSDSISCTNLGSYLIWSLSTLKPRTKLPFGSRFLRQHLKKVRTLLKNLFFWGRWSIDLNQMWF